MKSGIRRVDRVEGERLGCGSHCGRHGDCRLQARPRPSGALARAQAEASRVAVDADNIGGVVTSSKGPEAGVWVIAETNDFQTKFRKIVVTDDQGRYLIPQMPKANYKIWVRGYGLVDSKPVDAAPGKVLGADGCGSSEPASCGEVLSRRITGTPC